MTLLSIQEPCETLLILSVGISNDIGGGRHSSNAEGDGQLLSMLLARLHREFFIYSKQKDGKTKDGKYKGMVRLTSAWPRP